MHRLISLLVLFTGIATAAEQAERPVPRPRVRLQQTPQGPVARIEQSEKVSAPVMLDQVTVTASKLPRAQADEVPSDPKEFSVSRGGTLFTGKAGDAPYAVGLWPSYDLFWKDSRFKPQKTRADIEVVRVKL